MGVPALQAWDSQPRPGVLLTRMFSAVVVNSVGLYKEFVQGFAFRVRGKLSCLSPCTIVVLAKPSSVSSWVHSQWLH